MTRYKAGSRKAAIPFTALVILLLNTLPLLILTGCDDRSEAHSGGAAEITVVEKYYSDDPDKLSIGIVNKKNLVSPWGTESIEQNKQRMLQLIDQAKAYDINMVLFPEFSLTGYFWDSPECWEYMKQGLINNHLDWLTAVKSKLDDQLQYIIFNNIRLDPYDPGGRFLNSTYVISKSFDCTHLNSETNERFHIYDKTFLPEIEKIFTTSTKTDTLILDTQWGIFGFATCYDMCFTQIFQEYAMVDKIHAFIQVASWRGSSERHYPGMDITVDHYYGFIWDLMVSSQAAFNQTWIFACNAVGKQVRDSVEYEFWGGSGLWAPSGVKLLEASHSREELIVVHNVDIMGEITAEHNDFYYYDDFIKVYNPIEGLRAFTRMTY